ncbi:MAG: hypothetical protein ACI8TA_003624 [Cyclobacteriaceae bacterium]|jgi:hypothetical protein
MNKLFLIILTSISFATSAQDSNLNKVTIGLYPAFASSSTLTINFKKSEALFIVDETEQISKFKISTKEHEILKSVVNNLLNDTQLPIDTLLSNDGEIILLDGRLTEDGMTTYIYLNGKKDPAIQFGNSYSRSEAELLSKLTDLIRTRTSNDEYVTKLENYLN